MTVATAAPVTPMSNTKMKMGSSTIFTIAPSPWVYMDRMDRPVPCKSRSNMISPNNPREPQQQISR